MVAEPDHFSHERRPGLSLDLCHGTHRCRKSGHRYSQSGRPRNAPSKLRRHYGCKSRFQVHGRLPIHSHSIFFSPRQRSAGAFSSLTTHHSSLTSVLLRCEPVARPTGCQSSRPKLPLCNRRGPRRDREGFRLFPVPQALRRGLQSGVSRLGGRRG